MGVSLLPNIGWTQFDKVLLLQELRIEATESRRAPIGQTLAPIDSLVKDLYQTEHLGDLLRASGAVNVRSYGASTLATAGMRGGAA